MLLSIQYLNKRNSTLILWARLSYQNVSSNQPTPDITIHLRIINWSSRYSMDIVTINVYEGSGTSSKGVPRPTYRMGQIIKFKLPKISPISALKSEHLDRRNDHCLCACCWCYHRPVAVFRRYHRQVPVFRRYHRPFPRFRR